MPKYTKDDLSKLGLIEVAPGVYEKPAVKNISNVPPSRPIKIGELISFGELLISFPVDAMGKPRMTQQDRWKKRPATDRYWELKSRLKSIAEGAKFELPACNYHMVFYLPMADSWPKSKKEEMVGRPHQQKPDKDNLEKAVLDCLCKEDSYVWDGRVTKLWAYHGRIDIYKT